MSADFLFIHINEWGLRSSPDTIPISQAHQLARLKQHGFSGRILGDYKDSPLSPCLFREILKKERPAVLGFTVYEENINRVRVWAGYAKDIDPDLLVILGGPQITFMPPKGLLQMPEADILCRGEGEQVLLDLARALQQGKGPAVVPGICYRNNGRVLETEPGPIQADLDILPSPYLDDTIDLSGKNRVILFTSRGCATSCTFCYTPRASKRRIRFHSIARIIAEMRHIKTQGINDFWFADPNFAVSRKRLTALLSAITDQVPGATFWCQTRYDHLDRELAGLLKKAGAHTVAFGLESANQPVLARINKGLDLEKMARAIHLAQEAGLEVELFTMFGLPGEDFAQARNTLDFVKANRVAVEGNSISQQLHLFFGTPISNNPAEHGVQPLPITKPAYLSVARDFMTDAMSEKEIRRMSLIWRLNRSDFAEDVEAGANLFERAGFILGNYNDLADRPEAHLFLARIYMTLEEYGPADRHLRHLLDNFPDDPAVRDFLAGPHTGFKAKRRCVAKQGCKIIYDCKGLLDGRLVPETEGYYQEAVLGNGRLLPDFEAGITGMQGGRLVQFDVRFPNDYGNRALAGHSLVFQVFLHQVLEPVQADGPGGLADRLPRNKYRFFDLQTLRKRNENLYYMVLRDMVIRGLTQNMTDFFALLHYQLKLGFMDKAKAMTELLPRGSDMAGHAGRIFLTGGYPAEAAEILAGTQTDLVEARIDHIKSLINIKKYAAAEQLALAPDLSENIQALDLRVGLASFLQHPEDTYLARMADLLRYQRRAMASRGPDPG